MELLLNAISSSRIFDAPNLEQKFGAEKKKRKEKQSSLRWNTTWRFSFAYYGAREPIRSRGL
jgi:plasmid maintenance system killer protein